MSCDNGPCVYIKGVESLYEIWLILKNQYKSFDLATQYNAISQIIYQTQFDFSTIAKYGKILKKSVAKYAKMRNLVPNWLSSSFF